MFHPSRRRIAGVSVATAALLAFGIPALTVHAGADSPQSCTPTELFVSTTGNDAASGTQAHPWKTIGHARDVIRERGLNDAKRMHCDIDVNVRAGDYEVDSTINFDQRDSGANGHQVIYRSYDGPGKARLLGARQISGWQPYQGSIVRTMVGTGHPFYTLFEGDQRATTARYPNVGAGPTLGPYLQTAESTDDALTNSQTWLAFNPGDWHQDWDLHDAQVVIWSGGHWSWFTDTDPVAGVTWNKGFATLRYPTRYSLFSQVGSRYFLQNSLSFLDQPGEYYLDSQTGWLYYWPHSATSTIWAPTVQTILSVAGTSAADRAHDLTFDGFALEYSDFMQWYRYGWNAIGDSGDIHKYPDYDRQIELPRNRFGTITMTNTQSVTLRGLHISNTGFHAVYLLFANDHDTISDSLIDHVGADGVKIEGGYPGEGNLSHDNTLTDNFVDYVGELVPGDASGYDVVDSGHNTLSHSVIQHSARYAVAFKAITTVADADDYVGQNTLQYVAIAHAGEDSGDMGAIDAYGVQNFEPHVIESHMSQITITDVNADPSMPDSVPSGIHMDSGGCGFDFSNIEISNTEYRTPFHGDTHCNTFENDSWNDGFDKTQMQYDQIGVGPDFPYGSEAAALG